MTSPASHSRKKRRSFRRDPIRVAIVGTGGMANYHVEHLVKIPACRVVAACDVDEKKVHDFCARHGIAHSFTDHESLLAHSDCEAVCVVTTDAFHAPVSIACARAGRHVLCEKPLATSLAEANKMVQAARAAGVIHMVNFTYRNSSAVQRAAEMVSAGAFGRILHVEAHYYQDWLSTDHWGDWKTMPQWLWRLSTAHGSLGVLGDVGVHLLDFASFPVGEISSVACLLKTFPKVPGDRVGNYMLDANDTAVITATFANGAVGALQTTRWATGHRNSIWLAVYGEEGAFRIDLDRSFSQLEHCPVRKRLTRGWKLVETKPTPNIWERFITSIRTGQNDQPDFVRGAQIQAALEACFKSHRTGKMVPVPTVK